MARQLLIESMVLSITGGVLGSILALWLFKTLFALALPTLLPIGLPMLALDPAPDVRVLSVTLVLTLGTACCSGWYRP